MAERRSGARLTSSVPWPADLRFVFEPFAEAVLHVLRERAAVRLWRAAAPARFLDLLISLLGSRIAESVSKAPKNMTRKPSKTDYRDAARLQRQDDSEDQQSDTQHEQRDALQASAPRRATKACAPNAGSELGILGVKRTLNLVEQSLLVLGEWHSFLLRHSDRERRAITGHGRRTRRAPPLGASPSRIRAASLRDYPIRNHGRMHQQNPAGPESGTRPCHGHVRRVEWSRRRPCARSRFCWNDRVSRPTRSLRSGGPQPWSTDSPTASWPTRLRAGTLTALPASADHRARHHRGRAGEHPAYLRKACSPPGWRRWPAARPCAPRSGATAHPFGLVRRRLPDPRDGRGGPRLLGHDCIALTDHSPRLTVANGLSPERLRDSSPSWPS